MICYAMISAGVLCLAAGVTMLVVGLTGDQVVWFESGAVKITAGGFGAVTMLASVAGDIQHTCLVQRLTFRGFRGD